MLKRLNLLLILGVVFFASGCTSLKGNVPFQYQPSLISKTKSIDKSVGFNILEDNRPKADVKSTKKTIKDVPNKVTYKLMEDFKASEIFREVNYPPSASDDIIINGTLNRFRWRIKPLFTAFIPYLPLFGVPIQKDIGEADITLRVVDAKTGLLIKEINGAYKDELTYTLYNASVGEAGSELAEALRESVKQLKTKVLTEVPFTDSPMAP